MGVKRRPALPTDGEPKTALRVIPTARFSHFPYDLVARYVNHKVEFTVERLMAGTYEELQTPWTVRKLT